MAASKRIGGINVTITATIDKFQRSMSAARRALASFSSAVKGAVFNVKAFAGVLAGGIAVGAFAKLTSNAMGTVDAMGELSDKLGVGTEKLKGLELAASEAGISQQTLERALTVLSTKTGKAGDIALRDWIENTSKLSTQQEKLAASVKLFGSRGSSMVRFLNGGTAALDEAQQASERFGWALSRGAVAGVERAMDAFGRLKTAVTGIFANIAVEIAPFLEVITGKLTDFLGQDGRIKSMGSSIAQAIVTAAKFIADAIQKMVGGVLEMVADVREMTVKFRSSAAGKALGVGYDAPGILATLKAGGFARHGDGEGTLAKAQAGAASARRAADRWHAMPPISNALNFDIQDAISKAQADAAKKVKEMGPSLIDRMMDSAGKAVRGKAQSFMDATAPMRGMLALQMKMAQWGWANLKPQKFDSMTRASGVSAQDPLSREGFAQRVRSLGQNNLAKIGQQQLAELRKTRMGIDKLANPNNGMQLVAMNLLGGAS